MTFDGRTRIEMEGDGRIEARSVRVSGNVGEDVGGRGERKEFTLHYIPICLSCMVYSRGTSETVAS